MMGKKSKAKKNYERDESVEQVVRENEDVEKIYKRLTRIMSWIVGVSAILIILLPEFNSLFLDRITQILYYIFIITLLVFILLEFVGGLVKKAIQSLIGQK